MKKILLGLLVISLVTISCTKEDESNLSYEESSINNENTSFLRTDNNNNKLLEEFAKNHIAISKQIIEILGKNESTLKFDRYSHAEILNLTNENQIKEYYHSKGVSNPEILINNLKFLNENYKNFINKMPSFINIPNDEKYLILEKAFNDEMDLDVFWGNNNDNLMNRVTCQGQYQIDINRCNRNQAIGLGFSFVGGLLTGGVGGWLGAAASTTAFHFCVEDAIQDLNNCRN